MPSRGREGPPSERQRLFGNKLNMFFAMHFSFFFFLFFFFLEHLSKECFHDLISC